jgi:hypothetical protein
MFNIIKSVGSIVLSMGMAGKWLSHYAWGKGKDMKLPCSSIEEHVIPALQDAWKAHVMSAMDYKSCVARCGGLEGYEWWEGLAGVIGEFRWAPEIVEGGVWFHCWDRFDFNPVYSDLPIPMPKQLGEKVIEYALKKGYVTQPDIEMGGYIYHTPMRGGTLWVTESLLHKLAESGKFGKPFYTKWKVFIPNELLHPYEVDKLEIGEEGKYLRTKGKKFIQQHIAFAASKGVDIGYSYKQREWELPNGQRVPYWKLLK